MNYQAKAAQHKKDEVKELEGLMKQYPVVGMLNVENLPARPLQTLRGKLRKDVLIKMNKKQVIQRAIANLKDSKKDFDKLGESIVGMPAILLTKENPFKVSTLIRASKSKAPAKAGQVAPYDLIIPAGPTQFTPGPIISELGAVGLKTGVENGKVAIKEAATIVKEGEVITSSAVDVLAKFSIEPMEIGLDLVAAYENGLIYGKKVLSIKSEEYVSMITQAAAESFGLTLELGFATKDNVERLMGIAYNTGKNFALDNNLPSDVVLERDIGQAEKAAKSIAEQVKIEIPEKKKEEGLVKEEKPAEEKKEVPKSEAKLAPEQPKEEKKEEAPKPTPEPAKEDKKEEPKGKKTNFAAAEKISQDYKEEISAEKKRRDDIDADKAADMLNKLKQKGTLRE